MTGTVSATKFGYAFIRCDKGDVYFCHASEMPQDDLGRSFLIPGEAVEFGLGQYEGRTRATSVRLLNPRPAEDLTGYFEEGAVHKIGRNGQWAFVQRPLGNVAMLHWNDVKQCHSRTAWGHVRFYQGQRWRWEIQPPNSEARDAWRAVNAVEITEG